MPNDYRISARAVLATVLALLGACNAPTDTRDATDRQERASRFDRASAPVHQVSGGGKLDISNFFPDLPPETYAFEASVDATGRVRGQIEIRFSDPAAQIHGDVTCLAVSGTSAWIGIVVTQSDNPAAMPVGSGWWARMEDNGEGANDPPDRLSSFRPGGGAARCNERRPIAMPFAWMHGNIRVR